MAAWNLTRQGVNVLLLDAGQRFDRSTFWTHFFPYERRQRLARGERPPRFFLDTKEQPYFTPEGHPFDLVRVWGLGGKTNVWGRVSLRYSDLDFTAGERDGWEIPWPIRYADVAPYYDRVDQLIGVCGGDDDSDALPGSKHHLPPPAMRCGEHLLKRAAARLEMPVVPIRRATLTKAHGGFPKCHFCGRCGDGCDTSSFFNAADYLITPALATKRLEVRGNAVVARIMADVNGRASGVQYFDRVTGREQVARGKAIVLGASCVDSTRILLNSTSSAFPNGIGNGSGVIGKYLCEQSRLNARAFLPSLYGRETTNDDGIGGEHMYMPRFNHRGAKRDYLRGFGLQFWGIGAQAHADWGGDLPGFGRTLKENIRRHYSGHIELHPFGETLPRETNYVTVTGTANDRYGVPLPKVVYARGDNEEKMLREMRETVERIVKEAGGELLSISQPLMNGSAIHEHGTCRMGADPKRSALNGFNQMHDVKNLFVVDGSAFPSASEKNPTLTILALSWRATDYLLEKMKTGDL